MSSCIALCIEFSRNTIVTHNYFYINIVDCHGRVVFKVKNITSQQLRNSEVFYHIEWDNISVNTWEPAKHLDMKDVRIAITTWESQALRCVESRRLSLATHALSTMSFLSIYF